MTAAVPARLTATTSLARRIDGTELALVLGMAEAARTGGAADVQVWSVGGAAAVWAGPASPFNKIIGLGFGEAIAAEALAPVEEAYAARGARVQVELSTLADPAAGEWLTGRGYRLLGFENVLARRPGSAGLADPSAAIRVEPCGPGDVDSWIDTLTTAFLSPDHFDAPAAHESFDRATLERTYRDFATVPGVVRLLARLDGHVAGGASLYVREGVALLCGAATLPAHRQRGVQSALLGARLALARAEGCDLAVVTTQPGSKSQQNVQRLGFDLLYSRAILGR